jgi:predicted secreted acid phosphatase
MSARRSLQRLLAATALIALLAAGARAADCPAVPQPHIPPMPVSPFNIDLVKKALRNYHNGDYAADLSAVYTAARGYVESRAAQVSNPAVVLDIDETSLSNWPNIDADDFGFIPGGACDTLPKGPCGFNAWVALGAADAIKPALDLFNAAKAKRVAVLFVTARKESQREITEKNLHGAGYDGWTTLVLQPDSDKAKSQAYKTAAREKLVKDGKYTIIANIGDQTSDLAGGSAECTFKLPNPFYFIE